MTLEPGTAEQMIDPGALIDWPAYRACPTCSAAMGERCRALYARIENGQRAGEPVLLPVPHGARQRRRGW